MASGRPTSRRFVGVRRLGAVTGMGVIAVLATAGTAHAHPLGTLTVNHYDGLRLYPDRIENTAVVDVAELPTLQEKPVTDLDHDGTISDRDRAARASTLCHDLTGAIDGRLNGHRLSWTVTDSSLNYQPGAAGLDTSRLTCRMSTAADLSHNATFTFRDNYRDERAGWHEITAVGHGVRLPKSVLPTRSASDELRHYPGDLRGPPLDLRSATIRTAPTTGVPGPAGELTAPSLGAMQRWTGRLNRTLDDLVGGDHTNLAVGLLAGFLAFLLGASHALLPGHGKTAIAAYLVGRRGTVRDALLVGLTVTVTHTVGVLVLGLVLLLSASLAGEVVLAYLGLVGGLLVTGVGFGMLRSVWRKRHPRRGPTHTIVRTVPGTDHRGRSPSTADPRPAGPEQPTTPPRRQSEARQRVETPPWWWTPWQPEWRTEWQSPWVSDSLLTPTTKNARAGNPDHSTPDTDRGVDRGAGTGSHSGIGTSTGTGSTASEAPASPDQPSDYPSGARSDEDGSWWSQMWSGEPADEFEGGLDGRSGGGPDRRDDRFDDTVEMELPRDDLDDWPGPDWSDAVADAPDGNPNDSAGGSTDDRTNGDPRGMPTGVAAPTPTLNGHAHRDVHGLDLPCPPTVHQELPVSPDRAPHATAASAGGREPTPGQDTARQVDGHTPVSPASRDSRDSADCPNSTVAVSQVSSADSALVTPVAHSTRPTPPERAGRTPRGRRRGGAHRPRRRGLVVLGVAGGLVPSPSAMVVLLGAVALGHTVLGVALVLAYGLGVAVTLVAAGLLLVWVRPSLKRLGQRTPGGRVTRVLGHVHEVTPVIAGGLVFAAGLLLTMRALLPMG